MQRKGAWSEWIELLDYKAARIPAEPGVYRIATMAPLNRAVGVDQLGLLDVGESRNLKKRVASFVGCALGRSCSGQLIPDSSLGFSSASAGGNPPLY